LFYILKSEEIKTVTGNWIWKSEIEYRQDLQWTYLQRRKIFRILCEFTPDRG